MMGNNGTAKFVVSIPMAELTDIAIQEGLGDGPLTPQQMAAIVKQAIMAGLEDLLQDDVEDIEVRPTA